MKEDRERTITFFNLKGIDARIISNKTPGKTPDMELDIDDSLFGYCEIKSIVDYEFIGERPDPTYNKIQNKIHEGAKQFAAYNCYHSVPNLLLFINHFRNVDFQDLWLVLTGQATHPSNLSEPIDVRYALRLDQKKNLAHIDYLIWIDKKKLASYCLNDTSPFKNILKEKICSKACEYINTESS